MKIPAANEPRQSCRDVVQIDALTQSPDDEALSLQNDNVLQRLLRESDLFSAHVSQQDPGFTHLTLDPRIFKLTLACQLRLGRLIQDLVFAATRSENVKRNYSSIFKLLARVRLCVQ
jgi:hypothetical protein